MARKFLVPINLGGLELQNAVIQVLATAPSSPGAGRIYYDSALGKLRYWNGSAWVSAEQNALDTEGVQDIVGALLSGPGPVTVTYNDAANTLTIDIADNGIPPAKLASGISADKLTAGSTNGVYTLTEKTKLSGVATGATANATDAQLRDRSTHTGTQLAATISNFDTQVRTSRLDQMAAPTAAVPMNSQKLTGVGTPTAGTDAATKAYVDAQVQGLDIKASVKAATTTNITLSGAQTIDAIAVVAGDRVLVKNQTTASGNGIYLVATGSWTRTTDFDSATDITPGAFTFVEQGAVNADSGWVLTTDGTITPDTTALTFVQFSGAGQITPGNGLMKDGNTISVALTASKPGLAVSAAGLKVAPTVAMMSSYIIAGDGSTTAFSVRFNEDLGLSATVDPSAIIVQVIDVATGSPVETDIVKLGTNAIQVSFAVAPSTGTSYRVNVSTPMGNLV